MLYELVTGKHPFAASSPIGAAILRGRRPCSASSIRPGLPHRVDEVICKCLEFDVDRRYQSAKEVAEDLQSHLFSVAWVRRWPRVLGVTAAARAPSVEPLPDSSCSGNACKGSYFQAVKSISLYFHLTWLETIAETVALGDGLMDSLAGKLSNLDGANQALWVVPASEVRHRKVDDPSSALREFGATIAVKGRFERHGQEAD